MNRGDSIQFGTWPQEFEGPALPLAWRILEVRADGSFLLLCQDIIESRSYHDEKGDVSWRSCNLRFWLNAVFFPRAFQPDEQKRIAWEECTAEDNAIYGTHGGGNTLDRVFCLGIDQAKHLLPFDTMRQTRATLYAKRAPSTNWWWLRSPGGHQFSCATVSETGAIDRNGFHASHDCIGVRPALVLLPPQSAESAAPFDSNAFDRNALQGVSQDEEGFQPAYAPLRLRAFQGDGDAEVKRVVSQGMWLPPTPRFSHAGVALRYGLPDQAAHLLSHECLRPDTAQVALSGGAPSIEAVRQLLAQQAFSDADLFHLCNAAIRKGASKLAKQIIETAAFDAFRLRDLLRSAIEKGNVAVVSLLLEQGAPGTGCGASYLKMGVREDVARCAAIAEPHALLDCWDVVQAFPLVVRDAFDRVAFGWRDARQENVEASCEKLLPIARLPHILRVLATANASAELRALLVLDEEQRCFSREAYLEAIDKAVSAGFCAVAALLLDRQEVRFGGSRETSHADLLL